MTVDVGQGTVRGTLTEESKKLLKEEAPAGPAGEHTREYKVPFSSPESSLPERIAEVLALFENEYGDVDFTIEASFLGMDILSVDKKEIEKMMEERASIENGGERVECPGCGHMCFAALNTCPECGEALQGSKDG